MNNESPLIPLGSLQEKKNQGRARVRIAVFFVLTVHGIGLLALLMQGCKQDNKSGDMAAQTNTPAPPPFTEPSNTPPVVNANPTPPPTNVVAEPVPPVPPAGAPQDYTIAAGDKFSSLARKFNVSTKAIVEANPGVEPTKLQIGQKIHIPAPPIASAAPNPPNGTATSDAANGGQTYTVKSGDTLGAIARGLGVKLKAIRTANNLTTDKIVVGQKLKIPAKSADVGVTTAAASPTPGTLLR